MEIVFHDCLAMGGRMAILGPSLRVFFVTLSCLHTRLRWDETGSLRGGRAGRLFFVFLMFLVCKIYYLFYFLFLG